MIKDSTLIENLVTQSCKERKHALEYRNLRQPKWAKTDELYFGNKRKSLVSRANVHLPILNGAIETLLSKTDEMPDLSFDPTTQADRPKTQDANSLLRIDMDLNDWESIDVYGKKECYMYGRAIEKKYSSTTNGDFTDHRDLVACIDFLIDPNAGGLKPFEKGRFCGHENIIKTKFELEDKDLYDQKAVKEIVSKIESDAKADDPHRSHQKRKQAQGLQNFAYVSDDAVNLTEWYTTYQGVRYYILFSPYAKKAIRVEKLKDLFSDDEFPFSSWAAFALEGEFWSPAPAELFHDINYAQNILSSQLMDNAAFRNYGMKAFDKTKIPNPNQLDPRPQGRIAVNGNPNEAVMDIKFPSIGENLQLMNWLSVRFDTDTGVTQQAKGVPTSKRMSATEFNGLLDQVADRVLTYNKQYTAHYRRLARLYLTGLKDNLTRKRRISVLGAQGVTNSFVNKDSLDFQSDVLIKVSLKDQADAQKTRDEQLAFFNNNRQTQGLNTKFMAEKEAELVGFSQDEVARLTNPQLEGSWRVVAEAHQENERLLTKAHEPNPAASTQHVEVHLDFLKSNSDLTDAQRKRIIKHAEAEIAIADENARLSVTRYLTSRIQQNLATLGPEQAPASQGPTPPAPVAI